ncbi:trypsin-like peptidase domain-containing protein [Streptomyces sp. NPDC050560]|uniref:VMAP-C domain-containing protein n=1 Tax=Streptomyces sp. NPDC050560 TaxID=3365630 RepID=UPI00379B56ED
MPEPDPRLHALTRNATVHLMAADEWGGQVWGSGFFVAPGWVLTAAHVLNWRGEADRDAVFAVRGGDRVNGGAPVRARLAQWLLSDPAGGPVPMAEDLALVRLLEEGVDHPCVWLSDRAVRHYGPAWVYGYRPSQERPERPVSWSAELDITIHDDRYGLRFSDVELPAGVSGGPLLDPESGAVVALVKAKREGRDGGLAVSLGALRRFGPTYRKVIADHDKWHSLRGLGGDESWVQAQHRVVMAGRNTGGAEWTPRDRGRALRHLATLPPPPDGPTVAALARKARSGISWPQDTPELHTWRDGHGLLLEGTGPLDPLTGLRYLRLVALYVEACGGSADALTDWIAERLADTPSPLAHALVTEARLPGDLALPASDGVPEIVPYPGQGEGTTVSVLLDPVIGADPPHFFWQVLVDRGQAGPVLFATDNSTNGHRSDELVQALRPSLTEVFHQHDRAGRPVPLEVALPAEYFDMAVHRWRLDDIAALHDTYHLGAQRRVVLRCLARRGEPDELWWDRWKALTAQRPLEVLRVPRPRSTPTARAFQEAPAAAVPVICRSVAEGAGQAAMRFALEGGHGLALWRIDGHGGGCTDGCDDLHARVRRLLSSVGAPDELPDVLRRLREDISVQRTAQRWAEPLALLYDDPRRPLPAEDGTPLDAPS